VVHGAHREPRANLLAYRGRAGLEARPRIRSRRAGVF
jgi:hypothetical protein